MHFAQIYQPGLAHCSYILGNGKECVVVDPARDITPYLKQAKEWGMKIVGILETHLHADFISGHMDLQKETGATIYAPSTANCTFAHKSLQDEEEFNLAGFKFKLWETPGHTPDCAVYLVTDLTRDSEPVLTFTGDTLLIGDVGRPDLFPDKKEKLAEDLFKSIKRLKTLPDHLEVYPAHGMGSLCGRDLSAKLSSTIGTEKRANYALQYDNLEKFKEGILAGMPDAPDHFARCTEINRKGPITVDQLSPPSPKTPGEVAELLGKGCLALDIRSYLSFAAGHIPASYSISTAGNLPTFAGWILPPEKPILLIASDEKTVEKAVQKLQSVGLDKVEGFLEGDMVSWINSGLPTQQVRTISIEELKEKMEEENPLVLDNRARGEYEASHIGGTILAPTPDIRHRYEEWSTDKPIFTLCNTSNRSMTAASLLQQRGFEQVYNVLGGTTAWNNAGYPMEEE